MQQNTRPWKLYKLTAFQVPTLHTVKNFGSHGWGRSAPQKIISMPNTKIKYFSALKFRERLSPWKAAGRRENKLHHITFYDTEWDVGHGISLTWFSYKRCKRNLTDYTSKQKREFHYFNQCIRHAKITKQPTCSRTNKTHHFTFRWE